MNKAEIGQMIQYSLSPGIMISSSALFLSGLQMRFSNLFTRFRMLNHERRDLQHKTDRSAAAQERLHNLNVQLDRILRRVKAVRFAIISVFTAVLCFIATCLALFISPLTSFPLESGALFLFFAGLVFLLAACLFMMHEISLAFKILDVERAS